MTGQTYPVLTGLATSATLVVTYFALRRLFPNRPIAKALSSVSLLIAFLFLDLFNFAPTISEYSTHPGDGLGFRRIAGPNLSDLQLDRPPGSPLRPLGGDYEASGTYYQLRKHLSGSTLVVQNLGDSSPKLETLGRLKIETGLQSCPSGAIEMPKARLDSPEVVAVYHTLPGPVYSGRVYIVRKEHMRRPGVFALYNDPSYHPNIYLITPIDVFDRACRG